MSGLGVGTGKTGSLISGSTILGSSTGPTLGPAGKTPTYTF